MFNNTASTVIPIPSTYLQEDDVNFSKKKGKEIQNIDKSLLHLFSLFTMREGSPSGMRVPIETLNIDFEKIYRRSEIIEIYEKIYEKSNFHIEFEILNISDDAKEFLKKEPMIMNIKNKIIENIERLLENEEYDINIYMDEDMEIEDEETEYEKLVISIKINKSLEEEMELWDKIEDEVDSIINQIEDAKKREEINNKIAIEVVGFNDV